MNYPGHESIILEFKEMLPSKNQVIKTIIGFCNRFGGQLVIGVADNGKIIGLSEESIENINELIDTLHQSIFMSCTPTLLPTIYLQRFAEKIVLIVEVSPGMNKPYFMTSEGLNKGTYIRLGSVSVRATSEIIDELKWQAKGFSTDEIPIYRVPITAIDEGQFLAFLKARRMTYKINAVHNLMKHYKLIIEEHGRSYPTTAAILLFNKEPQHYLSEAFIICTHFKGISGREVIASRDCVGNLFQQTDDTIAFIISRLNRTYEIKGIKRKEKLEVPEIAIREVVVNAIVHRNYNLAGPIKIAVYDDRIEIFSPGNFPGPLQLDHLEMGITYIRNTIICKIFREAGYIEKLGSGFLTLFRSYREYNLPKPVILENSGYVKCILPRPNKLHLTAPKSRYQEEILRLFYTADKLSIKDIMKHIDVSRQTAARLIAPFIKEGILKRHGKGPATHYLRAKHES